MTDQPAPELTEHRRACLARVERLARVTDTGLRIPFTEIRFGLDAVLGLIPVGGDLAGLLLSLYLYSEASAAGAPARIRRRMIRNALIDALAGLVPVIGDFFDIAWRANSRNAELLRGWLHQELAPPGAQEKAESRLLWVLLAIAVVVVLLVVFWPDAAALVR